MKKTLLFLPFLLLALAGQAQSQSSSAMARGLKGKIKEKMKFTDVETDSVMRAEVAFLKKWRAVRIDPDIREDEKKSQLKAFKAERNDRIQSALHLPPARFKKLLSILPDQLIKD